MSVKGQDLAKAGIDTSLRFFARPEKFDFACPRCDWTTHVTKSANRRVWDPRMARLECMGCHAVYLIGIVAWQTSAGKFTRTPKDQTPTVAQALRLRRGLSRYVQFRMMKGRDLNVLFDELPPATELIKD